MFQNMDIERTDIFVSGGGIAGLAAAAAFGRAGFQVICVDPAPPVTDRDADGSDLRSTAFLQPARDFLAEMGLWDAFAPHATPLQVMRMVGSGTAPSARIMRDFDAADISDQPFAWNLPNWLLRKELLAVLDALPNVSFRPGIGFARLLTRQSEARVTLSDGTPISARLVIAADGRNSLVRHALGIGVRTMRYGQKALAFAVTHPVPHGNVSTEIHREGGPFTLVPLPDHQGLPCSSVVWMEIGSEAARLAAAESAAFEAEATVRSDGMVGPLTLATRRTVWPIISQIADRFTGERTALVAEAAHVVPPIGAQGLNMSLADIALLIELAQTDPARLGEAQMLDAYSRRRVVPVGGRAFGIDLLNRLSMAGSDPAVVIRSAGIRALHDIPPLRKAVMRLGLGSLG